MGAAFTYLVWLLGIAAGLLKLLDLWLRKDGKERLAELLLTGWFRSTESDSMSFVRAPLQWVKSLFDIILGPRIFSRRAMFRTTVIGAMLLSIALAISGAFTGVAFAGALPWRLYENNITYAKNGVAHTLGTSEFEQGQLAFDRAVIAHDGLLLKAAYMAVLLSGTVLANGLLDFVCIAIIRQLVREMMEAPGYMTLIAALIFDSFLAIVTTGVTVTFIAFLAVPIMLPILWRLLALAKVSVVATAVLLSLFGLFAWIFGSSALKIVAVVAALPTLIVAGSLLWAVASFPFKRQLHSFVTGVLLRVAESGPAALGALALALTAIAGIVAALASLI